MIYRREKRSFKELSRDVYFLTAALMVEIVLFVLVDTLANL